MNVSAVTESTKLPSFGTLAPACVQLHSTLCATPSRFIVILHYIRYLLHSRLHTITHVLPFMRRKRARSESCAYSTSQLRPAKRRAAPLTPSRSLEPNRVLPLTQENIRLLESLTSFSSMSSSRTSSPSRSNLDNRNKLAAYNISVDKECAYPEELEKHIRDVICKPRVAPPSPNAKKVVEKRRIAAQQNERGGIKQVEPYLLFRGEAEADDRVPGIPLIYSKDEINLTRSFLPQAPNANTTKTWGDLSQPRPDTAIGYVTRSDAENTVPPSQTAFSADEDEVLNGYVIQPWRTRIPN